MNRYIPVAAPALVGNEREYVLDCLESSWISSTGKYIECFETTFAQFCRSKHAISCCNGTVALHLALLALGVGAGDEVIVPTLTFVATANAVTYCGARPVFVDCEAETWNLDASQLDSLVTPRTRGIIVVHLYGHPVNMDPVLAVARRHGLFILEDAAEAHGAEYKGQRIGSIGDIATFSFYGNKIITTGEGGMIVTNDTFLARKVSQLKSQGQDSDRRYWFPIVGYNYRMTNLAAAIGLGQLEKIDWHIQQRLQIAKWYQKRLQNIQELILPANKSWAKNVYWLFSVVLSDVTTKNRDIVMADLATMGIETRPFFYPMHTLPPYEQVEGSSVFPVAEKLAGRGLNLPTWAGLTEEDVTYICDSLIEAISATS